MLSISSNTNQNLSFKGKVVGKPAAKIPQDVLTTIKRQTSKNTETLVIQRGKNVSLLAPVIDSNGNLKDYCDGGTLNLRGSIANMKKAVKKYIKIAREANQAPRNKRIDYYRLPELEEVHS